MIKIICLGKLKEESLRELEKDYLKRLSKYTKIELIEIQDENDSDINQALHLEKERILKNIKKKDNLVLLDIKGISISSEDFATFINKELTLNSNITFLIGSSNGFDEEIKLLTKKKISFSKLTFPHQLFRILLLEQIYRSFKIINKESYHK